MKPSKVAGTLCAYSNVVCLYSYFKKKQKKTDFQFLQSLWPPFTKHPLPHLHFSLCPFCPPSPSSASRVSFLCAGGPAEGKYTEKEKQSPSSSALA